LLPLPQDFPINDDAIPPLEQQIPLWQRIALAQVDSSIAGKQDPQIIAVPEAKRNGVIDRKPVPQALITRITRNVPPNFTPVPEPASLSLLPFGGLGLLTLSCVKTRFPRVS
jgi:hypothetical protein